MTTTSDDELFELVRTVTAGYIDCHDEDAQPVCAIVSRAENDMLTIASLFDARAWSKAEPGHVVFAYGRASFVTRSIHAIMNRSLNLPRTVGAIMVCQAWVAKVDWNIGVPATVAAADQRMARIDAQGVARQPDRIDSVYTCFAGRDGRRISLLVDVTDRRELRPPLLEHVAVPGLTQARHPGGENRLTLGLALIAASLNVAEQVGNDPDILDWTVRAKRENLHGDALGEFARATWAEHDEQARRLVTNQPAPS